MASAFHLAPQAQNAASNAIVDLLDLGSAVSTGKLYIFSGTIPGDTTGADGTLLSTINFNNPAFGSASAGVATMVTSPAVSGSVTASGTASWFRVKDRNNAVVFDGSIGTSGADMNFSGGVSFVLGGTVTIDSMTVTIPV